MGTDEIVKTHFYMFDPTKSKFYTPIMTALAAFFGKDPEQVTEAELDQDLQGAGTLAAIQENARNEALLAVQSKMDGFESRLQGLEATLAERDATIEALNATVTERQTQLEALQADTLQHETIVAANKAKIQELAGQVATLKAGKLVENDVPQLTNYETINTPISVKAGALNERFGFPANN